MAQGVQRTPLVGVPHSGHELIGPSYRRTPTDVANASMSALSSPRDTCTMGTTPFLGEARSVLVFGRIDRPGTYFFLLITEAATQAPQAQASAPPPSEVPAEAQGHQPRPSS